MSYFDYISISSNNRTCILFLFSNLSQLGDCVSFSIVKVFFTSNFSPWDVIGLGFTNTQYSLTAFFDSFGYGKYHIPIQFRSTKSCIIPVIIQDWDQLLCHNVSKSINGWNSNFPTVHYYNEWWSWCFDGCSSTDLVTQGRHSVDSFFKDLQILRIDFAHSTIFSNLKTMLVIMLLGELLSSVLKSLQKLVKHWLRVVSNFLSSITTTSSILGACRLTDCFFPLVSTYLSMTLLLFGIKLIFNFVAGFNDGDWSIFDRREILMIFLKRKIF